MGDAKRQGAEVLKQVRQEFNDFCIDGVPAWNWISNETRQKVKAILDAEPPAAPGKESEKSCGVHGVYPCPTCESIL